MLTGTTSTGFEFQVNEDVISDWRFITAIADAESGNGHAAIQGTAQLVRLLFDKKTEQKLMEHVKREDGIVPIQAVQAEVTDVFKFISENRVAKN